MGCNMDMAVRQFEQNIIADSKLEAEKQEATLEYEMAVRELRFRLFFCPRVPALFISPCVFWYSRCDGCGRLCVDAAHVHLAAACACPLSPVCRLACSSPYRAHIFVFFQTEAGRCRHDFQRVNAHHNDPKLRADDR